MNGAASKITALLLGMVLGCTLMLAAAIAGANRANAAPEQRHVYMCQSDEGPDGQRGPLPCVYDARHMGNGKGHSFLIRPESSTKPQFQRITHKRAHRLLTQGARR